MPSLESNLQTKNKETLYFSQGLVDTVSQRSQSQQVKNIILEHLWYVSCTKMFLRIYWQGKQAGSFMIFSLCTVAFLFHLDLMSLVFFLQKPEHSFSNLSR